MMVIYTSITKSYLPKARVLAKSVKTFHPEWHFVLLFSDSLPSDFNLDNEPFDEILLSEELGITNFKSWAFGHTIVELCTAVKGPAAALLARRKSVKKIIYLDPDIKVYDSLVWLEEKLEIYDIALTPHLLDFESDDISIKDNEISALKHGVFNLGFFAAKTSGQGLDFIDWWSARLSKFCLDNIPEGLFTDQRWCDLAPAFFDNLLIIRDRGYNVATWNISYRKISKNSEGKIFAGDFPLKFYHFTSFDSGDGYAVLMHYAADQEVAHEIWSDYKKDLIKEGQLQKSSSWLYGSFENGKIIPKEARRIYRDRDDLKNAFPNPFDTSDHHKSFYNWWISNKLEDTAFITNSSNKFFSSILSKWLNNPKTFIKHVALVFLIIKNHGLVNFFKIIISKTKGK